MSFDHSKGFEFWGKGKGPISQSPPPDSAPLFSTPSVPVPLAIQTSESDLKTKDEQANENEEGADSNDEAGDDQGQEPDGGEGDGFDELTSPNNSVANGEADEECLLRLRAKLFRFRVSATKTEWVEMGIGPFKLLRPAAARPEGAVDGTPSPSSSTRLPSRIVMRRENDRRGSGECSTSLAVLTSTGTKLLANILLSATATVGRQAEKAVRLTCFTEAPIEPAEGEAQEVAPAEPKLAVVPISYLFKTDSVEVPLPSPPPLRWLTDPRVSQNTDRLLSCIEQELRRSQSAEDSAAVPSEAEETTGENSAAAGAS
jgi:hypothetical protein